MGQGSSAVSGWALDTLTGDENNKLLVLKCTFIFKSTLYLIYFIVNDYNKCNSL